MSKPTVQLHPQAQRSLDSLAPPVQKRIWDTIEKLQTNGTKTPQITQLTGLPNVFMKRVPNHLKVVFTMDDKHLTVLNVCHRDKTLANFFKKYRVQDKFVQSLLEMAYSILRDKNLQGVPQECSTIRRDEASEWVSYEIHLPWYSPKKAADLTYELALKYAETDLDRKLKDKVIVRYTSAEVV
jgi:mRNA-degrading endonuclease RelE of RelBE toxin-antitoxin system